MKEKIKKINRKKTLLKIYLFKHDITQQKIRDFTGLSGGAISKLVSTGKGNKSTKKLVALFLKMKDDQFETMLKLEKLP